MNKKINDVYKTTNHVNILKVFVRPSKYILTDLGLLSNSIFLLFVSYKLWMILSNLIQFRANCINC